METLEIEAITDNLDEVMRFVDAHLDQSDCSMKTQMKIDIAVEELSC